MKKHSMMTAALTLALCTPGLMARQKTPDNHTGDAANTTVNLANPNAKEIQTLLGKIVEATTSKGNFDTLVSYLAKPDRDRIGNDQNQNWTDLDGRIDQFHKDWQAKFGQDFKLTDKNSVVFNDQIFRLTSTSQPTTTKPATTPSSTRPPTTASKAETLKSATVELAAETNAPATRIQLVNEGTLLNVWRIDLPDKINGQQLHDQLLARLTAINEAKNQWPSDVNMAYSLVSRQLLNAIVETGQK